jgi:hypothetical protein
VLTCFSKYYFGVECPGCGAQRSVVSLFRGDLFESIALYPALIPFMIMMTLAGLSFFKSVKLSLRWLVAFALITVVIMIGHYILKICGLAPWYDHAAACFH